jgi:hypothetical protein
MKLKSVFSRLPKWLILLVILAAFYFIFRKSVEGFACYKYWKKLSGICLSNPYYGSRVPSNGYSNSTCSSTAGTGLGNQPVRKCM